MATEKQELSASTDGEPLLIAAIASPGTTVHTVTAGATYFHEIYLYFINLSATQVTVTVEWGTQVAGQRMPFKLDPNIGLFLFAPGLPLNNGKVVTVFASVTNVVATLGYVHRRPV